MITDAADFGAVLVPLADVAPHPANFRHMMVDLDELAASIIRGGLDEPLVVMPADRVAAAWPEHSQELAGESWVLLWGHRRLAAARLAYAGEPKAEVPVVIRNDEACDSRQMQLELMTRNALAHRSWNPIEEAGALQSLVDAGRTQVEIAQMCGCHQSHVSGRLALLRLPEEIAEAVETGALRVADARRLARLDDHEQMQAVWRLFLNRREDAWITSIDQAIAVHADRAAYQARCHTSLELARAEGLRVVDPVEEFGARLGVHRLHSPEQVQAARAADNLVVGISGEGDLTYYTSSPTGDPPQPAGPSADQRRAAAGARERAARLLAASPPTMPDEAAGIVNAFLEVAPGGWRPIAQRWLRQLRVGPSNEADPDRWWHQVRMADWNTRVWAAHCIGLAACEHSARTHDEWDGKDVAWVLRLIAHGGYVPRRWERHRFENADDHSGAQTAVDRSLVNGWFGPPSQCQAEICLSEATVGWLELDPRHFHEVEHGQQCDLEQGHSGQHAAHVQDAHAEYYQFEQHEGFLHLWAWWDDETDRYRITPADSCSAIRTYQDPPPDGNDVDGCLLFAGHAGRHA